MAPNPVQKLGHVSYVVQLLQKCVFCWFSQGGEGFEAKILGVRVYEFEESFLCSDRSSACIQEVSEDLEHVLLVYRSFTKVWVEMHA